MGELLVNFIWAGLTLIFENINWGEVQTATAGIVAFITATFTVYKITAETRAQIKASVVNLVKMPGRISYLVQQQEELKTRIVALEKEFKPNGGSSLKDTADRVQHLVLKHDAYLRLQTQLSDIPTFEVDTDGEVTWINRAYVSAFNMTLEDITGKKWISHIHEADRERVIKEWDRIVKDKRSGSMSYRALARGGMYNIVVSIYATEVQGVVSGWVGYVTTLDPVK